MKDYYSFTTQYGAADKLFQAVLSLDKPRVEELKANGVTLTEDVKKTLVNGGGSMVSNKPAAPFWYLYLSDIMDIGKEDFVYISRVFREETDAPLYFSESLENAISRYFFNTAVFVCLTECYDLKKLNKTRTMKELVRKNRVDLLEICAKNGWLKQTKKRDELIEYANTQGKTECTAWLLDFKNRTADLAAERKKAEKKEEREFNAAPDSALELGKIWSWKKLDDGTIIITSYKGDQKEVTVPAKIGKSAVTEIAAYALSPIAPKLKAPYNSRRERITKIIVPNGIKTIGECAFGGSGVNTQWHSVTSKLEEVVLPETLDIFSNRKIAENALGIIGSKSAAAEIPHTENAEFYCIKNNINYRFADTKEVHTPHKEVIASDPLFSAVIQCDKKTVRELKEGGAVLTDYIKDSLLHEKQYGSVLRDVQDELCDIIISAKPEDADFILKTLREETGEPLCLYENRRHDFSRNLTPALFDCVIKYLDIKRVNKTQKMQYFIEKGQTEYLAVCAKNGWLKTRAVRDKMIQFAIDKNKTECTAWLLDFINRTADSADRKKRG